MEVVAWVVWVWEVPDSIHCPQDVRGLANTLDLCKWQIPLGLVGPQMAFDPHLSYSLSPSLYLSLSFRKVLRRSFRGRCFLEGFLECA